MNPAARFRCLLSSHIKVRMRRKIYWENTPRPAYYVDTPRRTLRPRPENMTKPSRTNVPFSAMVLWWIVFGACALVYGFIDALFLAPKRFAREHAQEQWDREHFNG